MQNSNIIKLLLRANKTILIPGIKKDTKTVNIINTRATQKCIKQERTESITSFFNSSIYFLFLSDILFKKLSSKDSRFKSCFKITPPPNKLYFCYYTTRISKSQNNVKQHGFIKLQNTKKTP